MLKIDLIFRFRVVFPKQKETQSKKYILKKEKNQQHFIYVKNTFEKFDKEKSRHAGEQK